MDLGKGPPQKRLTTAMLAASGTLMMVGLVTAIDWPTVGRWAKPHAVPLVFFTVAAMVGTAGILLRRRLRPRTAGTPPLSWWVVVAAAVVVGLTAWGATSWLLTEAGTAKDKGAARVEAIKTGLGIGAGTTGIFALLLAVRRQWHGEVDAAEKNTTELYTKAADQLGSDKAPVRLAGLYALERLAQGNPRQRQSIVNVICSYLRMPYQLPDAEMSDDAPDMIRAEQRDRVQEREVRLAAQRILADHLHPELTEVFWERIDLDLTGAHLINFDLTECRAHVAGFVGATFTGDAWFIDATFAGSARFGDATFTGGAGFTRATFMGNARFAGTTFAGSARFENAIFSGKVRFGGATFKGSATFTGASFIGDVQFEYATFTGKARFGDVTLDGEPFVPAQLEAASAAGTPGSRETPPTTEAGSIKQVREF
ncbi:pentapeptide repeat-containing protein [Amycolatopsis sp. NBC_00348]|uniref:pentapeptide repeat-containing protein n=1 Tax=Amycolatopsis sp. NBC_00348 TaxID=2975956 RepID=UPI002E265705